MLSMYTKKPLDFLYIIKHKSLKVHTILLVHPLFIDVMHFLQYSYLITSMHSCPVSDT